MNIFVLDLDPTKAAQAHNDKHVVKMVLETAQILCTVLNSKGHTTPYRSTHKHHPSVLWAGRSLENFMWLKNLGLELCKEYTFRYNKKHACEDIIKNLVPNSNDFQLKNLTIFAQAMPDEYKNKDPVVAYRNYYLGAKKELLKYTKREMPVWIKEAS